MAEVKAWNITTSGDRPLKDVARDLTQAGLKIGSILETFGVITGAADEDVAAKLRQVSGVTDVSPDFGVELGPPGSIETW